MLKTSSQEKIAKSTVIPVLVLLPVVSHAGGLGVAPLAFIMGLVGIFLHFTSANFKVSQTFLTLVLFLSWLCATAIWSPYHSSDFLTNNIKLFIMGLVFYFSPVIFKNLSALDMMSVKRIFLVTTLLGALLVTIDIWLKFRISLFFHPPSTHESLGQRLGSTEQNLGHAITLLVLLFAPITILLKTETRRWKVFSAFFFLLIILASLLNGLTIGVLGISSVLTVMLLAWRFPLHTPKVLLVMLVSSVIFAPFLGYISSQFIESDLSHIPVSWEHRLRMWGYCWNMILEHPIIGNGFDAARTYDETWRTRNGIDLEIVSLHPHNAGLHIWTEAGIIGALLATSFILSLYKPIMAYALTKERSACICGVMVATVLVCSLTYGAWQFWWWGCIFLTSGLIHLLPKK